jgi:hypothetical protein
MLRLLIATMFATVLGATAIAQVPDRAGTEGTVTAYGTDGTVLEVKTCFRTTRYGGFDYVRCGERLRDSVKFQVCRTSSPGTFRYLYQIGNGRKYPSSVYCRR